MGHENTCGVKARSLGCVTAVIAPPSHIHHFSVQPVPEIRRELTRYRYGVRKGRPRLGPGTLTRDNGQYSWEIEMRSLSLALKVVLAGRVPILVTGVLAGVRKWVGVSEMEVATMVAQSFPKSADLGVNIWQRFQLKVEDP